MNAQGHSIFHCLPDLLCDHNLTLLHLRAGSSFSAEAFPECSTWEKPEKNEEENIKIYVKDPMSVTSTMEMKPSFASREKQGLNYLRPATSSTTPHPSLYTYVYVYVYICTWIRYIFAY